MTCLPTLLLPLLVCADPATRPDIDAGSRDLAARWQARFEAESLHCVVSPPFVIAGDGGPARIAAYRDRTILAAANALWATFFDRRPSEPILILLFEGRDSYRRLAKEWFKDEDPPHFGYFRHDNIMVMNVGTGTGTLVHELVHALLRPDFPAAPAWFNEGLASLYEQCSLPGGKIHGLENWRLPALQDAIRKDKLRPLEALISDPRFYRADLVGANYAQARYLMFYLQEKGKLVEYYRAFRAAAGQDPTGVEALKKTIAPQTLEQFEKDWRAWVLTLRFG